LPHDEFVRLAAKAGFAGADPDFTFADTHSLAGMRDLYAANGLRMGGWGIPFDFRAGAGLDPEGVARLIRFAAFAAELGVDSCANHIMPGGERPFMEQWKFLADRLKPLAAILGEHGLRLGLEPVAPHHLRRKFPHAFIFTPWQMLELADDIGPNTGLLVDSIHFYTAGEPMANLKLIPKERIVNAHVNDAPAGPVELVEDRGRVLPGEGVMDVAGYLAALAATGYAGPVSVEVFSAALDALPPEEAARRARASVARWM